MSFKIEHRIGVRAPPSAVWDVLSDLEGWSRWNPLYPRASGKLAIGAKLSVTLALPKSTPEEIAPVVVDWVPQMQLVWRLRLLGGLITTTRYMEIEALDDGQASIFSHGEVFDGPVAAFMPKTLRHNIRSGFAAMSEALTAEVMKGRSDAYVV
jgi:hypothetical protein